MTTMAYNHDWADLAFTSKKSVRGLKAIFIAAPRELSKKRFTQLIKEFLPQSNIVVGLAKEPFIDGFDGQPQFKTLQHQTIEPVMLKVNASGSPHKIYTLMYFQRELHHMLEKLSFNKVLLVNGSWHHAFHNLPAYYTLTKQGTRYEMVSPFVDEQEAKAYDSYIMKQIPRPHAPGTVNDRAMVAMAQEASKLSFDYNFQTGAALGKSSGRRYTFLAYSFNKVVPFQTYAMHHGASRETHFSPPHDLNHYDTVHAEVEMVITAQKEKIDLSGTTLFVNLMPCPACARMLSETDINEIVYSLDHSDGYAVKLLEAAGKKVRRLVV
jgi:deoxycytidylate deaminase